MFPLYARQAGTATLSYAENIETINFDACTHWRSSPIPLNSTSILGCKSRPRSSENLCRPAVCPAIFHSAPIAGGYGAVPASTEIGRRRRVKLTGRDLSRNLAEDQPAKQGSSFRRFLPYSARQDWIRCDHADCTRIQRNPFPIVQLQALDILLCNCLSLPLSKIIHANQSPGTSSGTETIAMQLVSGQNRKSSMIWHLTMLAAKYNASDNNVDPLQPDFFRSHAMKTIKRTTKSRLPEAIGLNTKDKSSSASIAAYSIPTPRRPDRMGNGCKSRQDYLDTGTHGVSKRSPFFKSVRAFRG